MLAMKKILILLTLVLCSLSSIAADRLMVGRELLVELPTKIQWRLTSCTWVSNNPSVLQILEEGWGYCRVKGVSPGSTYVICYYRTNDSNVSQDDQFFVDVYSDKPTSIDISPSRLDLDVGTLQEVRAHVTPSEVSYGTITWRTENGSLATVSGSGLSATVSAVGIGRTTITATSSVNNVFGRLTVTGYGNKPTSVSIQGDETLEMYEEKQLTASFKPEFQRSSVSWSSSDPSVAEVSSEGVVTGIMTGTVTITAQTPNGCTGTKLLKVVPPTIKVTDINPVDERNDVFVTVVLRFYLDQLCTPGPGINKIELYDYYGTKIEGKAYVNMGYNTATLNFQPDKVLQPYTFYHWRVPKDAVVNVWGGTLQQDYHLSFKTRGLSEMTLQMNKVNGNYIYLNCSQSDAVIRYTTDNTEPTLDHGQTATQGTPVELDHSCYFWAKAFCEGYITQEVKEWVVVGPRVKDYYPKYSRHYYYGYPYVVFNQEITLADPQSYLKHPSMAVSDYNSAVYANVDYFETDYIIDGNLLVYIPRYTMDRSKYYWVKIPKGTFASPTGDVNDEIIFKLGVPTSNGAVLERIDLLRDVIVMQQGQKNIVVATPYPQNALNTYTWSSSNPSLVSVNPESGVLTAVDERGTAVITATSTNGITASCMVYVGMQPKNYTTFPEDGATDFQLVDYPTLFFKSKSTVNYTYQKGSMKLYKGDQNGTIVPGMAYLVLSSQSGDSKEYRLEYRPDQALEPNEIYYLTVEAGIVTNGEGESPISDCEISFRTVNMPVMTLTTSPEYTVVDEGAAVALVCSEPDAEIRYTLDNFTKPTKNSALYTAPITIEKNVTIWARAFKEGYADAQVKKAFKTNPKDVIPYLDEFPYSTDYPYIFKNINPYVEYRSDVLQGEEFDNCVVYEYSGDGDDIPGEFIVSGKRLVFVPSEPLDAKKRYAMYVPESSLTTVDNRHNEMLHWLIGESGATAAPLEDLQMLETEMSIVVGERSVVIAKPVPLSADYNRWEWNTSNNDVVTVSERGVIQGVAAGKALVTLTSDDEKKASCSVTVYDDIDGLEDIANLPEIFNVYDLNGQLIRSDVSTTTNLPKGIYIVNGRKMVVP